MTVDSKNLRFCRKIWKFSKCCNFFVFKYFLDLKKVLKSLHSNSFISVWNVGLQYIKISQSIIPNGKISWQSIFPWKYFWHENLEFWAIFIKSWKNFAFLWHVHSARGVTFPRETNELETELFKTFSDQKILKNEKVMIFWDFEKNLRFFNLAVTTGWPSWMTYRTGKAQKV